MEINWNLIVTYDPKNIKIFTNAKIFIDGCDVCIVHDDRRGRLLDMVLNKVYFIDKIIQVGNAMIAHASTKL